MSKRKNSENLDLEPAERRGRKHHWPEESEKEEKNPMTKKKSSAKPEVKRKMPKR